MRWIGFILCSVLVLMLLVGESNTARAHHYPRWTAATDFGVYQYGDDRDTFVVRQWVQLAQPLKWCTNFGSNDKPAIQNAISDWSVTFASWFGNEFTEAPSQCELAFSYMFLSDYDDYCNPAGWACYDRTTYYDSNRNGWYLVGGWIRFNGAQPWNYNRFRAVAAHELGHVHNMWEQYQDPAWTCWSGSVSIMDVNIPGWAECDPLIGPSSWDKSIVNGTYSLYAVQ